MEPSSNPAPTLHGLVSQWLIERGFKHYDMTTHSVILGNNKHAIIILKEEHYDVPPGTAGVMRWVGPKWWYFWRPAKLIGKLLPSDPLFFEKLETWLKGEK